ncbi:MAG: hypothetical protein ACRD0Q_03630 [Acidimicrobiales bacterium]
MHDAEPTLEVTDGRASISMSFDDLLRYHGRDSIGGLALGFKALELGLPLLSPGAPPERRDITVQTAFDGPGSRDAFEMATRAVTEDRYRLVPELARPGAPEAPQGHFVFRLVHRGSMVDLTLRPGLVGADFVGLVRRGPQTPAEEELLVRMKEELAARILALPADEVYEVCGSAVSDT